MALVAGVFVVSTGLLPAAEDEESDIVRSPAPEGGVLVRDGLADPERSRLINRQMENRRARDRPARLIKSVPTEYPDEFEGTGIAGEVQISMKVDRKGRARHVKVENTPDQAFADAALDSLSQWEFLPARKAGRVTNAEFVLKVIVSEELGDSDYFDYMGGRMSLEGTRYAGRIDTPAKRRFGMRAPYPWEMLVDQKPGEVMIEMSINDDGVPYDFAVLSSTNKEFSLSAQAALGQWRYTPALRGGQPVIARMRFRVSFQPGDFDNELIELAKNLDESKPSGLVPLEALDIEPEVLHPVTPSLPTDRDTRKPNRKVRINLVIDEAGRVLLPRVESAPDPLSGYAVLTAINYWHFSPGRKDKHPVRVNVTVPVLF